MHSASILIRSLEDKHSLIIVLTSGRLGAEDRSMFRAIRMHQCVNLYQKAIKSKVLEYYGEIKQN
jgi:hypothetical protein